MPPTLGNGKICYVEIPTMDVSQSASFYSRTFGWKIRTRGDGAQAFDDVTGEVSGAFVLDRPPSTRPGLLIYIMVDSVVATCKLVEANGGAIVQPLDPDFPEIIARFSDPAGNVLGLYQEPSPPK